MIVLEVELIMPKKKKSNSIEYSVFCDCTGTYTNFCNILQLLNVKSKIVFYNL